MAARVDEAAVVMLAVQLDQRRRQFAQQCDADGLVVDVGPAAAVGLERTAQDERFARFDLDFGLAQHIAHQRRQRGKFECGGGAALFLACPHQPAVGPVAQHQPERIEQDRLARAGLARQHAEPAGEVEVERFDQHDVADGKPGEHSPPALRSRAALRNVRNYLGKRLGGKEILTPLWCLVDNHGEKGIAKVSVLVIRAHKRFAVRRSVMLRGAPVKKRGGLMIELSREGCRISNADSLSYTVDQEVVVELDDGTRLPGKVRWAHDGFVGVRFAQALRQAELSDLLSVSRAPGFPACAVA